MRTAIHVVVALLAGGEAAAMPVEELFLGETSELQDPAELQMSAGMLARTDELVTPVALELGVLEHLQLSVEVPLSWTAGSVRSDLGAQVDVGIRLHRATARAGAGIVWDDRMERAWRSSVALGWSSDHLALYSSAELEGGELAGALGISLALARISPVVEVAFDRDRTVFGIGGVWRVGDDLQLGLAAGVGTDRRSVLMLQLVGEIDFGRKDD